MTGTANGQMIGAAPQAIYSQDGETLIGLLGPNGKQYPVGTGEALQFGTLAALQAAAADGTLLAGQYNVLNTNANLDIDVEGSAGSYIVTGGGNYVSLAGLTTDSGSGNLPVGTYQAGGQIYYWDGGTLTQITSNSSGGGGSSTVVTLQQGSANASANTTALQTALSNGGLVQVLTPGIYYISATGLIPNHTTMDVGDAVEFRQAGSGTFNFFRNSYWNSTPMSVSSITATIQSTNNGSPALPSNRVQVSVTYAGTPDVVVGDGVLIKGDTSGYYNGIWEVTAVSGSVVTFFMAKGGGSGAPGNGAGTITATRSNINSHLTGLGVLNGEFNAQNKTYSNNYNDYAVMWNNCKHPILDGGLKIWDTAKGGLTCANCMDAKSGDLDFVLNSSADCIHYYGPQFGYPEIYDLTGTSGDDGAVFQTNDTTGYTQFMPPNSGGSFYSGGRVEGIKLHHGGNSASVVFYPTGGLSSDSGYRMYGSYVVRDCGPLMKNSYTGQTMSTHAAFALANGYVPQNGGIENLLLENIEGSIILQNPGGGVITCGSITINKHANPNIIGDASKLVLGANIACPQLTVIDPNHAVQNGDTNDWYIEIDGGTGSALNLGTLNIVRPVLSAIGTGQDTLLQVTSSGSGATIGQIIVDTPTLGSNCFIVNNNDSNVLAGTPVLVLRNAFNLPSANYPITTNAASFDIKLRDGSCAAAIFNCYGSGGIIVDAEGLEAPLNTSLFANANNVSIRKWRSGNAFQYTAPVTGGSINLSSKTGDDSVVINPAGTLANLNIQFPSSAINGETRQIRITQAITALASSGGTVLGFPTSCAAGYSRTFMYSSSAGGWC